MSALRKLCQGLILVLGAGIIAATASAAAARKPQVALVMKSLANEFFQTMQAGATAHHRAHAYQYELLVSGIKNELDTAGQIRLIEQMLARRVDALIVAPADSRALIPVLQTALSRGVLVINIDNKLDAQALAQRGMKIPFVGPDNRLGAKLAGDHLAAGVPAGAKVAIIEGVPTTLNAQQRTQGSRAAIDANKLALVAVQSAHWELQKANVVAAAILREHPDLAAFLCGNDSMALGAIAAIKVAGKSGAVKVVGYDNIPAVKPMLADGRLLATVDQFPSVQAVSAIEIALKALADNVPQSSLPASVNTRVKLITR